MTPTADGTSRRQLLVTGTLGAAAAAFLAACGTKEVDNSGASGVDPDTTSVPPTVPLKEATEEDILGEQQNLRTAASLELVVADAYRAYVNLLDDADLKVNAARIAADHDAFAEEFNDGVIEADQKVTEPNEWVQTNMIDPIAPQLVDQRSVLTLYSNLESMLAATYLSFIAGSTTAEWRARLAAIAGGDARRSALMANGGDGAAPTSALYPLANQVSNNALLVLTPEEQAAE